MENLLQEERVAYLNEQNLMTEEKEKIMRDIKAKEEELRLENEAKEKIRKHINELEAKLLCGGKNIIDHTNEQQRILEKRRQELAEQKCIEREMQAKLLEEEESTFREKKETYDSLQQEVDMKTKKLKKLFQRFQTLKDDINDESEINSFERQDKEQTIEALTRDLKLSNLVIDNFVNPEDKAKFLEHVKYDEDEDAYVIFPSEMSYSHFNPAERPSSANHLRRPMTSHAIKMNRLHSSKPRYKSPEPVQRTLGRFGARTSSHCGRQLKSRWILSNILCLEDYVNHGVHHWNGVQRNCPNEQLDIRHRQGDPYYIHHPDLRDFRDLKADECPAYTMRDASMPMPTTTMTISLPTTTTTD
ncbi:kinesin-like protein KIF3B [Caerostris extrusa]|uniref:Kinesin-like protein KIF3B n=1 Tax=Caerostris extrusa TaxID=172846 RepID=A0AAV4RKT9_CAEEX|nr:kinesin-like protein KIF3B [Caerostris extrusa]